MAVPANERVLLQTNPTAVGVAQGVDLTTPPASDFFAGHNFARGDGYVTPSPDTTFGPPGSGTVPPDVPPGSWPSNGNQIPAGHLFAPIGTADTLSIDLVAESVLNGEAFATIASGGSDWVVTGGFSVIGGSTDRAAVSLDFNIVERMVVYSWDPANDAATASNTFAFDVLDSSGQSVFGPAAGANPSITRLLSSELLGAETYNNNTLVPTHVYPGPVVVNFQTMPLPPGDYSFTMKAATTAYVTALPEPAVSTAAAGLALAAVCRFGSRRRTVRPSGP